MLYAKSLTWLWDNMSNIIIETSRIKVCQYLYDLCDYCGYEREWTDSLWQDIA